MPYSRTRTTRSGSLNKNYASGAERTSRQKLGDSRRKGRTYC